MSDFEATIRAYFEACNARNLAAIASFFVPQAVHYFPDGDLFPDGQPQRAFIGSDAIARGFAEGFAGEAQTYWSVDRVLVNEPAHEAVIEWSNFKPSLARESRLRGAEWYAFDADGLIAEIRAYYACPPSDPRAAYELGGFDYGRRGYPLSANDVLGAQTVRVS